MDLLHRIFPRWSITHFPYVPWLAYSVDLSQPDYMFWEYLKCHVYDIRLIPQRPEEAVYCNEIPAIPEEMPHSVVTDFM
jgi:hypothetical protein